MKNNLHTNPLIFKLLVLVTCFMLVILYNKSQASGTWSTAKSRVAISFLQRVESNEVNVTVKGNSSADLQLYLFNTEGRLVKEFTVCCKKVTTITNPGRGCYLYECFKNDTRMSSGSFILK